MIKSKNRLLIIPLIFVVAFAGLKLSFASTTLKPLLEIPAMARQQSLADHYNSNCNKQRDTAEWTRLAFK